MDEPTFNQLWDRFYYKSTELPTCILYQEYALCGMMTKYGDISMSGIRKGQSLDGTVLMRDYLLRFTWEA